MKLLKITANLLRLIICILTLTLSILPSCPTLQACVEQLCSFVEDHLRDLMTHVYGSHVIRSLLEVLGGVSVNSEVVRSRMSRSHYKEVGRCHLITFTYFARLCGRRARAQYCYRTN